MAIGSNSEMELAPDPNNSFSSHVTQFHLNSAALTVTFWSTVYPESSTLKVLTFDRLVEFSQPRTFGRTGLILHCLNQK